MELHSTLDRSVTLGIVQTSGQHHHHAQNLVQSLRVHHGPWLPILVASLHQSPRLKRLHVRHVPMNDAHVGLAAGRNAICQAAQTPYVAFMDADAVLRDNVSLLKLISMLKADTGAAVAGGCYHTIGSDALGCNYLRFHVSTDGSVVSARAVNEVHPFKSVHIVPSFFVARTDVLRRFRWDSRQRSIEQESFFYQLYLNRQPVLACPSAVAWINRTNRPASDHRRHHDPYRIRQSAQYVCKNFPEVRQFSTPAHSWDCDTHRLCEAQSAYGGTACEDFSWDPLDDDSVVPRQLVAPHDEVSFPPIASTAHSSRTAPHHIPLLVFIFTQASNAKRRAEQRKSWLFIHWHRGPRNPDRVPWRHLYIRASPASKAGHAPQKPVASSLDEIVGDTVTLSRVKENYQGLVFKALEAFRWALERLSFGTLLKTDDDSLVHIGRLWRWLAEGEMSSNISWVYAGRLITRSQVVRPEFSRKDLWHPEWYPDNFSVWAVPHNVYDGAAFPPYCSGGGYLLGNAAVSAVVRIYARWPASRVVPLEDAFLGILGQAAQLAPVGAPGFEDLLLDTSHTQEWGDALMHLNYADKLLVHRVAHPRRAVRFLMMSVEKPTANRGGR